MSIPCPGPAHEHTQAFTDLFASPKAFAKVLTATPTAELKTVCIGQASTCALHIETALTSAGVPLPEHALVQHKVFHLIVEHLERAAALFVLGALTGQISGDLAKKAMELFLALEQQLEAECAALADADGSDEPSH